MVGLAGRKLDTVAFIPFFDMNSHHVLDSPEEHNRELPPSFACDAPPDTKVSKAALCSAHIRASTLYSLSIKKPKNKETIPIIPAYTHHLFQSPFQTLT